MNMKKFFSLISLVASLLAIPTLSSAKFNDPTDDFGHRLFTGNFNGNKVRFAEFPTVGDGTCGMRPVLASQGLLPKSYLTELTNREQGARYITVHQLMEHIDNRIVREGVGNEIKQLVVNDLLPSNMPEAIYNLRDQCAHGYIDLDQLNRICRQKEVVRAFIVNHFGKDGGEIGALREEMGPIDALAAINRLNVTVWRLSADSTRVDLYSNHEAGGDNCRTLHVLNRPGHYSSLINDNGEFRKAAQQEEARVREWIEYHTGQKKKNQKGLKGLTTKVKQPFSRGAQREERRKQREQRKPARSAQKQINLKAEERRQLQEEKRTQKEQRKIEKQRENEQRKVAKACAQANRRTELAIKNIEKVRRGISNTLNVLRQRLIDTSNIIEDNRYKIDKQASKKVNSAEKRIKRLAKQLMRLLNSAAKKQNVLIKRYERLVPQLTSKGAQTQSLELQIENLHGNIRNIDRIKDNVTTYLERYNRTDTNYFVQLLQLYDVQSN